MNNTTPNKSNDPISHPQVPETPHPTEPEGAPDQPLTPGHEPNPYPVTDPPLTPDAEPYSDPTPVPPFPEPLPGVSPDVLVQ